MQKHILFLQKALDEFNNAKQKKKYAKNNPDRNSQDKIMSNQIQIVELYFNLNDDLHQLYIQENPAFDYEESLTMPYFSGDMGRFIDFLRQSPDK